MNNEEIKQKILRTKDIKTANKLLSKLDFVDDEIEQYIDSLVEHEWIVGCYIRPNKK